MQVSFTSTRTQFSPIFLPFKCDLNWPQTISKDLFGVNAKDEFANGSNLQERDIFLYTQMGL